MQIVDVYGKKYTDVSKFSELGIKVHERDFVKEILELNLSITNSYVYQKKGQDWLKFECTYTKNNKEGKPVLHKDVLVGTSGEKLVEAGKQFNATMYPIETKIVIDDKGFYEFI